MKRAIVSLTLCALALAPAFAAKKKPLAPIEYANFRTMPASCDAVWNAALNTLTSAGFVPQASDKAGGVLSVSWHKGDVSGFGADRDAKLYTKASRGALTTYLRLRIEPASIVFTTDGSGCRVQMNLSYSGWKQSMAQKGWVAVESNGRLESEALQRIEREMGGTSK